MPNHRVKSAITTNQNTIHSRPTVFKLKTVILRFPLHHLAL